MRNYRNLSPSELNELISLYPTTTNRELSRRFDISVDAMTTGIVYENEEIKVETCE